ncbi:hypothetical protein EYC84_010965 [Monilinia fructicola]|uniref:Uncharacterized protein n=1 Tax=Monilinia fructicola TaxID=38448 RepID=A0A5M9JDD6_MONFR|nr:hypothetical protein EYC84_010965 [Monilinia fructicola]
MRFQITPCTRVASSLPPSQALVTPKSLRTTLPCNQSLRIPQPYTLTAQSSRSTYMTMPNSTYHLTLTCSQEERKNH